MKITLTLTPDDFKHTELDQEDLAEAVKDLVDSGIYFDEITVEVMIINNGSPFYASNSYQNSN